jgi:GNAT superfamily N-acetyltransferase
MVLGAHRSEEKTVRRKKGAIMEWTDGEYRISSDKSLLSVEGTHALLSRCLCGNERSRENIRASMEHSICYGVFHYGRQIGFARVVTDSATVYWLCDVLIDQAHRGRDLGKKLVECIVEAPELKGLLGLLATSEAHGLYEKYGFVRDSRRFMLRSEAARA